MLRAKLDNHAEKEKRGLIRILLFFLIALLAVSVGLYYQHANRPRPFEEVCPSLRWQGTALIDYGFDGAENWETFRCPAEELYPLFSSLSLTPAKEQQSLPSPFFLLRIPTDEEEFGIELVVGSKGELCYAEVGSLEERTYWTVEDGAVFSALAERFQPRQASTLFPV